MVHRLEGPHLGELGMYGYDNACFWFGKTGYHPLFPEVRKKSIKLLSEFKERKTYSNLKDIEISNDNWNPDYFTLLCRKALENRNEELLDYCNEVTNIEWNLLFEKCNKIVNTTE